MPSSPVFAYKTNGMVDEDKVGMEGSKQEVFMRATIDDHFVVVIVQVLNRA